MELSRFQEEDEMAGKREKTEDIVLKLRQFTGCAGCHSLSISDIPKMLWR
jgi:hypothetical protein